MLLSRGALVWGLCVLLAACRAAPQSGAGTVAPAARALSLTGRPLKGRFLHITDFHPDPFYKTYSSTEADAACHRRRGPAGFFGAETSACDSPFSLVNETFKWIDKHIKDDVDFVVWTGDSARHDNDERLPRTQKQIVEQNEFIVNKFAEVFGKDDNINDTDPTNDFTIPIVPTFGNNDIMPHNILLSGPNKWTMKYLDIWRNFIPEPQRHQFQQGGWFHVEVIPGKLAVFSLNTMYFFDSNSGVDGCADKNEPGYEHMEWLRIQLQILRERGMKAILMGHVPPARTDSKLSWDETCWQKFTLWERQYRDVIIASLFGHMNIDHFMLQDFKDLKKSTRNGRMASSGEPKSRQVRENMLQDGEVTVASASDYILDLGDSWARLPVPPKSRKDNKKSSSIWEYLNADDEATFSIWEWIVSKLSKPNKRARGGKSKKKQYLEKIGGRYAERYSVAHVSPSVVPNYFPTLRIFSYNISGLVDTGLPDHKDSPPHFVRVDPQVPLPTEPDFDDDVEWKREVDEIVALKKRKKQREARKKPKKFKFKIPEPPSTTSPPGPAYSPQSLTLLGYVQYFANLTYINNDFLGDSQSEHGAGNDDAFGLECDVDGDVENNKWKEGKHGKHQGKQPRPKPHPNKFKFEVEYDTKHDKRFKLKDLTVRSYVDLARRIGQDKSGRASLESRDGSESEDEDEDLDEDIGIDNDDDELHSLKKGKKKKKRKHGKKHKHDKDGAWFTFVKRAFVGSMDPRDIEELFSMSNGEGNGTEPSGVEEAEIIEL